MRRDEPDRGRRPPRDRGQSTVELALALPAVLVLALAVVQVGLVVRDQVRVTHAAREGARAAAVSPEPGAARRAVERDAGLAPDRLDVVVSGRTGIGSHVTVTVRYEVATDLALIGPLLPDLGLSADATMRVEQ
jgi:Flp pilus assembly protein TadG